VSQPSFDNIEVSLTALRQEAAQWERVSQLLAPVATFVAETQDISGVRMGIFAPAHEAYHQTCQVVTNVAKTGAAETSRISDLLANIAVVYEAEEQKNAADAQSIHEKLGKW
jgi:hypothetical protein